MNDYGYNGTYGPGSFEDGGMATKTGSEIEISQNRYAGQFADRRILFMGMPGTGKTSILRVVFDGVPGYNTVDTLPTREIGAYKLVAGICVYDFPGLDDNTVDQYTNDAFIFEGENTSLVLVVDSQGESLYTMSSLLSIIRAAQSVNEQIPINIFINKVDGLSTELQQDIQQDVQSRILKEMGYDGLRSTFVQFFLTSIYSESIFDALSRVAQRLVPRYGTLQSILDSFYSKSNLEKVFLCDTKTKLYLSTDASPIDPQIHKFTCQTISSLTDLGRVCSYYIPQDDDDEPIMMNQKLFISLEGNFSIFIYQVDERLSLFCTGHAQVIRQQSLLEFNGAKVARAIRQILSS
ncbi:GTP-binding protein gtr2 [Dipsacomyces acuminosporus]|nr:GTP-binding protein gtr2 [Dipsacomyces acuminosporus]